ncbi:hypothetical protein [Streptomyces sp. NPDC088350]|uniref:hypothetical protein n=1 Tax=Streptomyces sp. NPDC088350 TaxID=3365854 RepID=UPI003807290A
MRPSIESALKQAAELTRNNRLVDAVATAEAAISQATADEHPEIQQWLTDHASDFTGQGN